MIIEHRTYRLHPGKVQAYFDLYMDTGLPIQLEYLRQPLGYYTTELGPLNQIIHLWGYNDLNERHHCRNLLKADPRWTEYVRQIMPLIQHQESKILMPAPFFAPQAATYRLP
ncbi:NIPSNAP family protein [Pseudomonas sp. 14P_8.1_Bac3]|uniref:NIPSNAP family protein n=1 Tax=Pseudomonas sp. 14P_8.1_Bac3 TaxID=2971621 RepID=UPI0021C5B6D2|nr:NIPSNAP family protein [Pseudomonas sp. 14P_8.1_Bac3]MCU1760911.1 NIPSNAP family protein [Pseudomonas sp. 14P_8.1_Bac3]